MINNKRIYIDIYIYIYIYTYLFFKSFVFQEDMSTFLK